MPINPLIVAPLDLYTTQTLTVSGGATPTLTSDPTPIGLLSKIHVFVQNTGTSTNCTVTIKGKPTSVSTMESVLAVFTLTESGTTGAKAGRYIEQFPNYVCAVITNLDAVAGHTAILTVTLDRFR